jgi:(p)ppGpp synthase/HD superfamily hydrolase
VADLERAIRIAAEGHAGQRDKAGAPYILHPIRVMMACSSEVARIVAMLHDVVEDTDWTLERLADEGFAPEVLEGIAAVTKRPDEKGTDEGYLAFCRRAAAHPIGREVKRADLLDNMDLSRLGPELGESDLARLRRYRSALEIVDSA